MEERKEKENAITASGGTAEVDNSAVNFEPDYSVWKQIVLLHTRTAWKNYIIISTITLQFQLILYDISFRGRTAFQPDANDLQNEKLAMDGVYFFDVISAVIYKNWTSLSSTYGHPTRSIVSLVFDVLSLLPFDWIHRSITNEEKLRVSYLLSTNHLLRIHRLFSFFRVTRNSVGQRRISITVLMFLILIFVMTGVAVAAMINTVDMVNLELSWLIIIKERSSFPKTEFDWSIVSYYVLMTQISGHGLPEVFPGIYSFAFILIVLGSLWLLQAFAIAYLTDIIFQRDYNRSLFHREMHLIESYLDDTNAFKETREKVIKYYNYVWKTQGNSEFEIMKFNMYPSIFLKECALELAWDAFKHSHLFRDQPIPFLRNLGQFFEREYYRPGETIFEKYERKSKLVYVVTGVVQFLSEEDDKSAILSFSGGTIICESTLILSHRSLCNVVAGTEVELNVLHRDKFVQLMVYRYQSIYRILQSRVRFRYWKAHRMVTIGAALQKNKSHIVTVPACTDVAWLKQTLTVLQNRQSRAVTKKEKKEMQTDSVFATTDFRYTFANLDMLVISEDIAIVTDQVCLNNGRLPWIFYPDSTILNYWKGFILICCFAQSSILPIYASQSTVQSIALRFYLNILSVAYIVDLLITSTTSIHENDMIYTNIIDIISKRMHYVSYWADIVAAFPADWILKMFGIHDHRLLAYSKLNRLVKIYKLEEFFSLLEERMISSQYKIRVMKYTFYILIVTYFSSTCILLVTCPHGKCPSSGSLQTFIAGANEDMKGKVVISAILYASQIIVGVGTNIIVPILIREYLVSMLLLIIGAAVFNYVISSVAASQILDGFTKSWLRFYTINIALMLNRNKVPKSIQGRVFRYLEMVWLENNAYTLTFERQIFDTTTPKLRKELNAERLLALMKGVELFEEMEEECIKEICAVCKPILFPPQEVVGYGGHECREIYVIEKGYCQVWRNVDMSPMNVTTGTALYVLEMFCNLNHLHTVTTVTHVSIVKIKLKDLMQVLAKFPTQRTILAKVIKKFKNSDEFTKLLNVQADLRTRYTIEKIDAKWNQNNELSRTKTSQKNQGKGKRTLDTAMNNDSEKSSWKKTVMMCVLMNTLRSSFSFFRLFLLKSTINPDGRFIKIWAGISCTCAYLLIALYSTDTVFVELIPEVFGTVLILALNFMMIINLYVRLHVQFYNSHRILVTHPLSTAKNYISSGMIVDVVALFPLENFFVVSRGSHNHQIIWFCRLNRLLMTHRIIAALRHHHLWSYMSKYLNCVMFLPIIILIGHVFACGLLLELCHFGIHAETSENFAAGIYCSPKNVEIQYKVDEPITPVKMYIYSLLYVLSTLTRIGAVNLRPLRYTAILYVLFITLLSFLVVVINTTYTISTMSRRDVTLIAYQEQMMILVSYLKENNVTLEFRDEIVNYFENFWILRRGTSMMKQMRLFPRCLREDVLWSVYGPSLTKTPGFSKRDEPFFRSLFSYMKVKFYSKSSEVMKVNLVHRLVCFIHWGRVEAIGPDNVRIAVLGSGSVFGNFTSSGTMRQTCGIRTRTHVEALVFESSDFFDLMMRHPETKKRFLTAVALNTDYLRADTEGEEIEGMSQTKRKSTSFILLPNTTLVQAWEIFSVFFSCYFAFAICFYHFAITQFTGYWLLIIYSVDIGFLIKMGLVFFTAFEDELGDYVVDRTLIARRFRESKLGLYFHIFTIIPFEIFCLLITDVETRWHTLPWLRMNRVPRLILVNKYFRTACSRLNINVSGMRLFYAGVLLVSLLHIGCCLMMINEKATTNVITSNKLVWMYIDLFHTVTIMFTSISSRIVPTNTLEALLLIILFLVFHVAHAMLLGEVCAVVNVNQFVMNEYERRISFFRERVTRMNLTYVLRTSAWSYGSRLWMMRSGQQTPRLINEAPIYIQYGVSFELYSHHLLGNEIFGKLHEDFIRQLTFHFKDNLFFPGDRIANVGDVDETMYFIEEGIVGISSSELNLEEEDLRPIEHQTLGPGQYFGLLQGLYENLPHTATYVAKTTTHIIYLYRPHWVYLLKYFPVSTRNLYKSVTLILRSSGLEI